MSPILIFLNLVAEELRSSAGVMPHSLSFFIWIALFFIHMDIWISLQLLFEDLRDTTSLKGSIPGATERIKQIVAAQNAQ